MVLLRDVGQVETRFGPLGDIGNLDVTLVHSLCRAYHTLRNHFVQTQLYT
jgi:hypothetical protein